MTTSLLLSPENALVLMIDVQENHFSTVVDGDQVVQRLCRFLKAARVLDVPMLLTEHYPRGFGPTLAPVKAALAGIEPISKTAFGCFGEPRFAEAVAASGRKELYLVGAETHICIQQTALAAREQGLAVVLLTDCVTARSRLDHDTAIRRLESVGVIPATWESVVYEWLRSAKNERFKQILPIVKGEA